MISLRKRTGNAVYPIDATTLEAQIHQMEQSREQRATSLLAGIFKPRQLLDETLAPAPIEFPAATGNEHQAQAVDTVDATDTDEAIDWTIQPSAVRAKQNMTQEEFGAALRIPVKTIRNWEQERVMPDPAARALLTMLDANPKAMAILDKVWRPKKRVKATE